MEKNRVNRSAKNSFSQSAEMILKEHKKNRGEVIRVVINARTTFEFPAHFSPEEIAIRIENYKKRHNLV